MATERDPKYDERTDVRGRATDRGDVRAEDRRDERVTDSGEHRPVVEHRGPVGEERAYERFGGTNWGAAFFGWIVAIGVAVLLTGIIGAVATAVGYNSDVTQTDAQRSAGTIGLVAAIVLVAILLIAYYAGGYVAGRMSRFDGGRQGASVWVLGLLITILAVLLGWLAGDQYNVIDRVDLPSLPIPDRDATWGGVITAVVVLVGTLLAAVLGGKVGRNYHRRVDREF